MEYVENLCSSVDSSRVQAVRQVAPYPGLKGRFLSPYLSAGRFLERASMLFRPVKADHLEDSMKHAGRHYAMCEVAKEGCTEILFVSFMENRDVDGPCSETNSTPLQ